MNQDKKQIEYISSRYRWIYNQVDKKSCIDLSLTLDVPFSISETLFKRGLTNKKDMDIFFDAPLAGLFDPFTMKDMEIAVDRIIKAYLNKELICIFGDYDVDGVTSTAILYLFLKKIGANVTYYIPNRLGEGYGLNVEAIDELKTKKVDLIVTVDCGISAHEEVKYAKSIGIDVIITDHHQPSDNMPLAAVAIVNPMRSDDEYAFKSLSGVGVAFKLSIALRNIIKRNNISVKEIPNLKQFLDIVALGTIADVVPLVSENRILVTHGLKILSDNNVRVGLDELKKVSGLNKQNVQSSNVGYSLAPRINAVGRMGDSDRGFKLLITDDRKEAFALASELEQENKFRQKIEKEIMITAVAMAAKDLKDNNRKGLVLYAKDWHPGVVGIIASRIVEKFNRPTIVLTEENGILKGSARSIRGFHLYDGLKEISGILLSFGGHKYAAGLKIDKDTLDTLRVEFNNIVDSKLKETDYIPLVEIDSFLEPKDVNEGFVNMLKKLEPYGSGNKEPIFCMTGLEKYQSVSFVGRDANHAKCFFTKDGIIFDCIGYDMKKYEEMLVNNKKFDILFSPVINSFYKNKTVQLVLKDLKISER